MTKAPITLRLHRRALARADGWVRLLQWTCRDVSPRLVSAFAFKNDELHFARRVLREHARIWLFRCHQRAFAADFVAVDMSCSLVEYRPVWCLDLKRGADVKVGGGGAGNAFVNMAQAIGEIADTTGVVAPDQAVTRVTGDGARLIERLFAVHARAS